MNTLIIYDMVPEETIFVLVPTSELSKELGDDLVVANGSFVNSVDCDEEEIIEANIRVSEAIGEGGAFCKYVVEELPTSDANIQAVYLMGFFL